ncbi:MAG: RHS repeat-associated core domain-containing protein [bacterium]
MKKAFLKKISLVTILFLLFYIVPVSYTFAHDFGGPTGPNEGPQDDDCQGNCCEPASGGEGDEECKESEEDDCATGGSQVSFWDGAERFSSQDLIVRGLIPIVISRFYDNQTQYDSPMGYGWSLSYNHRLYKYQDGSVVLRKASGLKRVFVFSGGGYVSPPGEKGTLVENPDGSFTYIYPRGRKHYFDLEGKLSRIKEPDENELIFTYDGRGKLPLVGVSPYSLSPDPDNPTIVAYDYRLTKIEEKNAAGQVTGHFVTLAYNETTGRISAIKDCYSRTVAYEHDTYGNLITVTDPMANISASYEYNDSYDPHNITHVSGNGGCSSCTDHDLVYDQQDRVIQETQAGGILNIAYEIPLVRTNVTKTVKDNLGNTLHEFTTTYEFNDLGNPIEIIDARGNKKVLQRDYNGNLGQKQIWENQGTLAEPALVLRRTTDYGYDIHGNKISEIDYLDGGETITRTYTYDHNWLASEAIVSSYAPQQKFMTMYEFYYDAGGNPKHIKAEKRVTSYDAGMNPLTFSATSYTYDNDGHLLSIIYPDGLKEVNVYTNGYLTKTYYEVNGQEVPDLKEEYTNDARGNHLTMTDAKGNTTHFEYDIRDRVVKITNPLGEETIYSYTENNLTQIEVGKTTSQGGHITKYYYNDFDRMIKIERMVAGQLLTIAEYTYDSEGNRLSSTDPVGHTTFFSYDEFNRLLTITDALNHTTGYSYDLFGNMTKITDAEMNTAEYTYDNLDRLIQIKNAQGGLTKYAYDAAGNRTIITDAKNHSTHFKYDLLGRLIEEKDPMNFITYYAYVGGTNRLDYTIDPKGQKTDYDYNALGQLTDEKYFSTQSASIPERTIRYEHDLNGNITKHFDDSISPTNHIYQYSYDALNRTETIICALLNKTIEYAYDTFGNRIRLTLTSNGNNYICEYGYNDLDEMISLKDPKLSQTNFEYYSSGRLKKKTYPNMISAQYTYLNNGPLENITYKGENESILSQYSYTYNKVSNIKSITSLAGIREYKYDTLYQLIEAKHPDLQNETFTYDGAGNRLSSANYSNWTYDNNNRLLSYNGTSYNFDDNGNMIRKTKGTEITEFHYNIKNRLIKVNLPDGKVANYTYDPLGRRIKKEVDGAVTWFLYDGMNLLAEFNEAGNFEKMYIYNIQDNSPLGLMVNNTMYYYHNDHLGTPQMIVDGSGSVVWSGKYNAFGKVEVDAGATILNNLRFPGQYEDAETRLYYNMMRYYDPCIGRYLTSDPFGMQLLDNLYIYAEANPINYIDSLGLWTCPTDKGKRGKDVCGSGEFEASREGGKRKHAGVDYCGSSVKAPIGGAVEIIGKDYNKGVRITGKQNGTTYTVIIRHIDVSIKAGTVKEGQTIGTPMPADKICKGMKAHAHVEVYKQPGDKKINPDDVISCD